MGAPMALKKLILHNPFVCKIPDRMVWTQSSLKLFRNCKRKFFWKYLYRLDPKYQAHALVLGTAFHECLGEWYKGRRSAMRNIALKKINEMREQATAAHEFYNEDEWIKLQSAIAMFEGMMIGYEQMYSSDRAEWLIARETIERRFRVNCGEFDFEGMIDLQAALRKKNDLGDFLVEHKTASQIDQGYIQRISLDTQTRAYVWGAKHGCGIEAKHVLYDVVRKSQLRQKKNESATDFCTRISDDYLSRPGHYFYREPILVTESDLAAFEFEMRQTHEEFIKLVSGQYGDPHDPRTWGINDDYCYAYFKMCEFHQICTGSLDRGTATFYDQRENLHRELA